LYIMQSFLNLFLFIKFIHRVLMPTMFNTGALPMPRRST
jgi:hypothetical protein